MKKLKIHPDGCYIHFLFPHLSVFISFCCFSSHVLCNLLVCYSLQFFSYTETISFITLLSGKQAPLIFQASSVFFKLMLFHTSFILLSHSIHPVSSVLKYLSCLELILLPLILAIRDRQCLQRAMSVCGF